MVSRPKSSQGSSSENSNCHCTLERVKNAILLMGTKEIEILISENIAAEATCEFCGRKYRVEISELNKLLLLSQKS